MKIIVLLWICSICFNHSGISQDFRSSLKDQNTNYKQIKATLRSDTSIIKRLSDKDLKRFDRWDWYWRSRTDSSGSFDKLQAEMIKYSEMSIKGAFSSNKKSASSFVWESLGPNTRPAGSSSTIGRGLISTIWVNPSDTAHILIGASNGGLWKTVNGGINWSCLTEGIILGGVKDIAVHPTNNNIIYVGTQVRAANGSQLGLVSQYSLGLFKTTDGGVSWTKLNTSVIPIKDYYERILIHPTIPTTVYALTIRGIYKTVNSGTTWTSIGPYLPPGVFYNYRDMEFKPNDPNTIYVSGANTLEKSTDGGLTWTSIIGNLVNVFNDAQIAIAVDINKPNYIYALYSNRPEGHSANVGLELSTNGGSSWTVKQPHGTSLRAAGFLTKIWVSTDSDVFAGGIYIKKSSDEGSTFSLNHLRSGSIHADIRDLCFPDPNNGNLIYAATDGGVYFDDNDGNSWSRKTGDLALNEFYSVGITKQNTEILTGGSQDCGSVKRNSDGSWTQIGGGDGGLSLIDQTNHNIYYYTVNRGLYSSISHYIGKGGYFDAHVNMDPTDSETMYRSEWDTSSNPPVKLLKTTDKWGSSSIETRVWDHIWDLTICESEPNAYYFTTYDTWSTQTKIFNCPNGGNSCNQVNYTGISDIVEVAPATDIVVHPFDKDIAWVTFGGFESGKKVYLTTNGGNSWTNHTFTGLPNLPIQCLEYDFLNETVFVGTDIGAFFKSINDNTWELAGDLPQVMITKLVINKSSGDLFASTFGRGMYRTNLGVGYCYDQNPLTISSTTTWSSDNEICSDIIIASGGTLNLQATITMGYNSTIIVQNNGLLKINAGELVNGKIIVQNGGSLEIINSGIVNLNYEDNLQIESGGTLQINSGEILINSVL